MTKKDLDSKTKDEILEFIRQRLSLNIHMHIRHADKNEIKKEHRRFDMSGYENETGECTLLNSGILNEFAYLGIYDYTTYLFLDFYKGCTTLYYQYFNEGENLTHDLSGYGTTDIILEIFKLTIFSNKSTRRRS